MYSLLKTILSYFCIHIEAYFLYQCIFEVFFSLTYSYYGYSLEGYRILQLTIVYSLIFKDLAI
jgi:hypothetical protein